MRNRMRTSSLNYQVYVWFRNYLFSSEKLDCCKFSS